ncbi:hypothetical protein, partial [Rhizobium sp. S9]|uniref:hypothetical protein n=1 Tax=Rhizobium sp. S9 TaxID=2035454 RepID=UPI001AF00850
NPGMTRIPVAQPHYTATATYKDEALIILSCVEEKRALPSDSQVGIGLKKAKIGRHLTKRTAGMSTGCSRAACLISANGKRPA